MTRPKKLPAKARPPARRRGRPAKVDPIDAACAHFNIPRPEWDRVLERAKYGACPACQRIDGTHGDGCQVTRPEVVLRAVAELAGAIVDPPAEKGGWRPREVGQEEYYIDAFEAGPLILAGGGPELTLAAAVLAARAQLVDVLDAANRADLSEELARKVAALSARLGIELARGTKALPRRSR